MLRVIRNVQPLIRNSYYKELTNRNFFIVESTAIRNRRYTSTAGIQQNVTKTTEEGLKLTESCVARLKEVCVDGSFLRITVEGGGCSGFQYKFDFDKQKLEDDLSFGPDNAKVVIDSTSLEYVAGATIDYHVELIRAGFRIVQNPKAEGGCSCGASFSIKID